MQWAEFFIYFFLCDHQHASWLKNNENGKHEKLTWLTLTFCVILDLYYGTKWSDLCSCCEWLDWQTRDTHSFLTSRLQYATGLASPHSLPHLSSHWPYTSHQNIGALQPRKWCQCSTPCTNFKAEPLYCFFFLFIVTHLYMEKQIYCIYCIWNTLIHYTIGFLTNQNNQNKIC